MTEPVPAPTVHASHRAADTAAAVTGPWTSRIGWQLLPTEAQDALAPLFRFLGAVRAVADHPALSLEHKEAALAALAAPFSENAGAADTRNQWAAPAEALARSLAERSLDRHASWQILQAAGQDLRKTRYRDWSELLMWCRFSGAPTATLAFRLVEADPQSLQKAEMLGIALQLVEIVRRAPGHHTWLGRVYLPERWFAEAGCEVDDLRFAQISRPLQQVLARTLDQAQALLDDGEGAATGLAGFRLRRAFHAAMIETRREIALLRRQSAWARILPPPKSLARASMSLRAGLQALKGR